MVHYDQLLDTPMRGLELDLGGESAYDQLTGQARLWYRGDDDTEGDFTMRNQGTEAGDITSWGQWQASNVFGDKPPGFTEGNSFDCASGRYATFNNAIMDGFADVSMGAWVYGRTLAAGTSYGVGFTSNAANSVPGFRKSNNFAGVFDAQWNDGTNRPINCSSNTVGAADTWYHVFFTWDSTTGESKMYVNGIDDTRADSSIPGGPVGTHTGARIGGGLNASSNAWDGFIYDFIAFDRVLTPAEVLALKNGNTSFNNGRISVPGENYIANDDTTNFNDTEWTTGGTKPTNQGSYISWDTSAPASKSLAAVVGSDSFLWYIRISGEDVAGKAVHMSFGEGGSNPLQFSVGYNWETAGYQQLYASGSVRTAGGNVGVGGIATSTSHEIVEAAFHYDSVYNYATLFIKENGIWERKGGETVSGIAASNTLRVYNGGGTGCEGRYYYSSFCKFNFASIGDSICSGALYYSPDPTDGLKSWRNCWQATGSVYAGLKNNLIYNGGIGSESTTDYNARLAAMLTDTGCEVMFYHAGNNDYGAGISLADHTTNIDAAMTTIQAAGKQAVLINSVYPNSNHGNYPASNQYQTDWWDGWRTLMTNRADVEIDTAPALNVNGEINPAWCENDGIHPTQQGHEITASEIVKFYQ